MARYGFSIYGQSLYGAPLLSIFSAAPVVATPVDYGTVLTTWHVPGGNWNELRVIRNYLGYPVSVDNGDEIFTTTPTESGSQIVDTGLRRDHWVYYTVFVYSVDDGEWVRSGIARCFVPSNYDGADRMFRLIPEEQQSPTLQKFTGILGYAYDLLRNDINSLLDLYDSMAVSYDLVPVILQQFGIPIEPELEPEQYRRFLRNAAFFYKVKGTEPCVHGVVAAITGWQCTVAIGANLLWTADYSDFVGGVAGWTDLLNASVSWAAPSGPDSGSLQIAATATAAESTISTSERIPLPAGATAISMAALVRALDLSTATASVRIAWYDVNGALLGSTDGTAVTVRETADSVVRIASAIPLTGTVTFSPVLVIHNPTAGQRWQWRQVMVNAGAPAPYEPGHDIRISLSITDTDLFRRAVHLDRLSKILPRYLPLGATFTLLF